MLLETIMEYYDTGAHYAAASTDGGVTFRALCNLTSDTTDGPSCRRPSMTATIRKPQP